MKELVFSKQTSSMSSFSSILSSILCCPRLLRMHRRNSHKLYIVIWIYLIDPIKCSIQQWYLNLFSIVFHFSFGFPQKLFFSVALNFFSVIWSPPLLYTSVSYLLTCYSLANRIDGRTIQRENLFIVYCKVGQVHTALNRSKSVWVCVFDCVCDRKRKSWWIYWRIFTRDASNNSRCRYHVRVFISNSIYPKSHR